MHLALAGTRFVIVTSVVIIVTIIITTNIIGIVIVIMIIISWYHSASSLMAYNSLSCCVACSRCHHAASEDGTVDITNSMLTNVLLHWLSKVEAEEGDMILVATSLHSLRCFPAWHGMAWHNMTWHGMAQQSMAWHSIV